MRIEFGLAVALLCASVSCMSVTQKTEIQAIRVDTDPPNAVVWKEDDEGRWKVGRAPTNVVVEYEIEERAFNQSAWAWLALPIAGSVAAAIEAGNGDSGDLDTAQGVVALGICVAATAGLSVLFGIQAAKETERTVTGNQIRIGADQRGFETSDVALTLPMDKPELKLSLRADGDSAIAGTDGPSQTIRARSEKGVSRTRRPAAKRWAKPPKIWLFTVGISNFANPSLNLKYAASDASAFFETLRSSLGKELAEGRAVILNDSAAKREVVTGELAKLANKVSPQDMLIIFIATHGLPDPDTNEIAFLMHDTDPNNLLGTGLTQSDLESILRRSPAGKVLFVLDACHSGSLGTAELIGRRAPNEAEINQMLGMLAKATDGTAILSASSAAEMSLEGEQWKGGAFTYFLLDGLRGAADTNRDQTITLRELYDFVYDKVSDATDGEQHPELKGHFSNELPLAIVNP